MALDRIRLPQDAQGFVRRSCPQCARHFKTRALPTEDHVVQATLMSMLQHANASELPELPQRFCPYCGGQSPAQTFLTGAQRGHIEGWANALTGLIRYERLRLPTAHLSQNPFVTYLPVEPPMVVEKMPPEPDDMSRVVLMCCGEEQKLLSDWNTEFFCHYCRARQKR